MEAYCVKCKTKREMLNPLEVEMKNKKKGFKGVCPECGTKMFRIGGIKQEEPKEEAGKEEQE